MYLTSKTIPGTQGIRAEGDIMKKTIKIFEREHNYDSTYGAERDIRVIDILITKVKEPFILSYSGLESINYYIAEDNNFIGSDLIRWLYDQKKEETNTKNDLRKCMLMLSIEDVDWTKQRNEDLTGIYYRKAIFTGEIQEMLISKLTEYKTAIENLLYEWKIEIQESEKAEAERRTMWIMEDEIRYTPAVGGESGTDGYHDAVYKSSFSADKIRMVQRDVFDFGVYSYPKRLEGTDDIFNIEKYTDAEKQLDKWLSEFGKFKNFRM